MNTNLSRAIFILHHAGRELRFDPDKIERNRRRQERAERTTLADLHKTIRNCEPPPPEALEAMDDAERAMVVETEERYDQAVEQYARIALAAFDAVPIGAGASTEGQIELTEAEAIAALNAYWNWSDDLQKKRAGSPSVSPTTPDSAAVSTSSSPGTRRT